MEQLKSIKQTLMGCIQGQMAHLDSVDTKELGEAIDMIKDLEEAMYYCTVTKAMEEKEKENGGTHYYTPVNYNYYPTEYSMDKMYYPEREDMMYYPGQPRDSRGRFMYGNGGNSSGGNSGSSGSNGSSNGGNSSSGGGNYYTEPMMYRDPEEGRSPEYRKMYMESKHTHQDQAKKMRELEKYAQELTSDIVEMVEGASPEEKQYLSKKINMLATKIEKV